MHSIAAIAAIAAVAAVECPITGSTAILRFPTGAGAPLMNE